MKSNTLPETNIAPKNGWLEYYFPIGEAYFHGLMLVYRRIIKSNSGNGNMLDSYRETCWIS